MNASTLDLIRFQEAYFERIWGGDKLRTILGRNTPADKVIGEAWIVSDHESHESIVSEGPHVGKTLRQLLEVDPEGILGTRAALTAQGRFPLLLKILDSAEALSVQVHPDDTAALRLGEPDVGKTEMWHVFQSDPESELICGIDPSVKAEAFAAAIADGSVEEQMTRFAAPAGTSTFVSAGTVHAIGGGIILSEIQQNSNITYRLYDWGRVDDQGCARELHVDKGLEVTHFGSTHGGASQVLDYDSNGTACSVLGACEYFAAELIRVSGYYGRDTRGESFHLLQAKLDPLTIRGADEEYTLHAGEVVLVPGALTHYKVTGDGELLDYYVPDLERDIVAVLRAAGHSDEAIVKLGGAADRSNLAAFI
jgi:mannose-6-phosphate isomerase